MSELVEFPEVTAGIAWLDKHEPGWAERIDLEILRLASKEDCIVCQVAGIEDFGRALSILGLEWGYSLGFSPPCRYGVTIKEWYSHAESQWRRTIAERINSPKT